MTAGEGPISGDWIHTARRFARFAIVGASGVLVNLAVLALLVEVFGWNPMIGALLSIEVSTVTNFLLNRSWTWRDRDRSWWALVNYHAVTLVGTAIQWTTMLVLTGGMGLHYALGSIAGVGVATAWNFIGNDRFSFLRDSEVVRLDRMRTAIRAGAFMVYIAASLVLAHPWDTFVFQESVQQFLGGTTPYETGWAAPDYIYPGGSLPLTAQWYAYPPLPLLLMTATYGAAAGGVVTSAAVGRMLIKLPFILGTFGLAALSRRLVLTAESRTPEDPIDRLRRADGVERALLLNPLFFLVATVWGQFEALMLLFLVAAVLALRHQRTLSAGAAFGGALLLKVLPLYVLPVLAVHLVRTGGQRALWRFGAAAAGVFALVSLPFLLAEPAGFYQQVVGMHAARPPARFSPTAALYFGTRLASDLGLTSIAASSLIGPLSLLSFLLTATVLLLLGVASSRSAPTERNLLLWLGLSFAAGLLATKVLNEQYVLLPLGLLTLACLHPDTRSNDPQVRRWRPLLAWGGGAVAFAALADNFHFFTFVADDVLRSVLGMSAPEAATRMSWALGLTRSELALAIDLVTGAVLLVPFVLAIAALWPHLAKGASHLAPRISHRLSRLVPHPLGDRAGPHAALASVLVLLLLPVVGAGIIAAEPVRGPSAIDDIPTNAVYASYRTDWFNPTNDPKQRAGTWDRAQLMPTDGYYNPRAKMVLEDMMQMRSIGIDGVLLTFDPYHDTGATITRRVAEQIGMPYVLDVDLGALHDGHRVPLGRDSATAAAYLLNGPGIAYWNGADAVRVGEDRAGLVVVHGIQGIGYTFSSDEWAYVLDAARAAHVEAELSSDATNVEMPTLDVEPRPLGPGDLVGEDPQARLWRAAYRAAVATWWSHATADHDGRGALALVPTDAPVALPPLGPDARWSGTLDTASRLQRIDADSEGRHPGPRLVHLGSEPISEQDYGQRWQAATEVQPDMIVVPWNGFHDGRAIEPTEEYGRRLLERTAKWTTWWHEQGAQVPTTTSWS